MTYDVDLNEMKAYILNKFKNEGDFDFLKEGLIEELVDEMMSVDQAYLAKLSEDDDYEDDDVYEMLIAALQNKYPNYNHDFAVIADAVNPLKNTQVAILSVNPCDFLKMSYGEGWDSCHHVGHHGCYHAGTQSYIMDSSSMILKKRGQSVDSGQVFYIKSKFTISCKIRKVA